MDFIGCGREQRQEMLDFLGIKSVEELWDIVDPALWHAAPTHMDGLSEYEGLRHMELLAAKNSFPSFENYLGGGAYEHHIPAIVSSLCSNPSFLTSYTPYQAEISQGMLQIIFEFQSAICALTGLDASNASLYDGASACGEAALMALRCNKDRDTLLISEALHPHYRAVLEQYISGHAVKIKTIPVTGQGTTDFAAAATFLNERTAALLLQSPNFFGFVEDSELLFKEAARHKVMCLLCANPLSYGLFSSAAEVGADIAIGDTQPFGIPLQFGGPYAGYISCKEEWVRQLPGRIVGKTEDREGRTGFVLTLQAREQHIRREKATSNICSNQALAALASLISISWYGKEGVQKLAQTNFQRASYLRNRLQKIPKLLITNELHFNEFTIKIPCPMETCLAHFRKQNIEPGIPLNRFFPQRSQELLIAVTETKNRTQLDRYAETMEALLS